MSRIAVDVVLLPDEAMTERAIRINRRMIGQPNDEILLNRETCLPHISLAMGCVDRRDITAMQNRLQNIAREKPLKRLNALGILTPAGGTASQIEIERTSELQALHEAVMREIEPLFTHDVTAAMIYDKIATESTLEWIREYPRKAAFERFTPHITLGYGRVASDEPFPICFAVSQIALCHLGNHCTCREVLGKWDIGMME